MTSHSISGTDRAPTGAATAWAAMTFVWTEAISMLAPVARVSAPMADVKNELHDQDKAIDVTLDQPIDIHLWEDRTRGELWIATYDPSALALLGDDYLRVAGNNAVDNGQRTFAFKPIKPGRFE